MNIQFIAGKPVTTTNFKTFQPLGVGGQLVLEKWNVLYNTLKHSLGRECAGLLLEPVVDRQRGEVDWYIPEELQSVKVAAIPRDQLLKKAKTLVNQGQNLAHQMMQSADMTERQRGELLAQALSYPNDDMIIATPYGVALVGWGHEASIVDDKTSIVTGKGDERSKPFMSVLPPPQLPPQKTFLSYLPWILSLLLLLLTLLLPWWEGLIRILYCRDYWVGPLILLLLLLSLIIWLCARYIRSYKTV